jgi:hypothetical protein
MGPTTGSDSTVGVTISDDGDSALAVGVSVGGTGGAAVGAGPGVLVSAAVVGVNVGQGVHVGGQVGVGVARGRARIGPTRLMTMLSTTTAEKTYKRICAVRLPRLRAILVYLHLCRNL